eukprot:4753917-Amphidinium_carterae.1
MQTAMPAMSSGGLMSNSPLGVLDCHHLSCARQQSSRRGIVQMPRLRIYLMRMGVLPWTSLVMVLLTFLWLFYADARMDDPTDTPHPDLEETQITPPPSPLKLKEEISQQEDIQQHVFGVIDLIDDDDATD